MPKSISQSELDSIIKTITAFSEGAGIEEIQGALGSNMPHRTLQRRLALLVERKRITVEGRARASRYRLPGISDEDHDIQDYQKAAGRGEVYMPISSEGEEIK